MYLSDNGYSFLKIVNHQKKFADQLVETGFYSHAFNLIDSIDSNLKKLEKQINLETPKISDDISSFNLSPLEQGISFLGERSFSNMVFTLYFPEFNLYRKEISKKRFRLKEIVKKYENEYKNFFKKVELISYKGNVTNFSEDEIFFWNDLVLGCGDFIIDAKDRCFVQPFSIKFKDNNYEIYLSNDKKKLFYKSASRKDINHIIENSMNPIFIDYKGKINVDKLFNIAAHKYLGQYFIKNSK